MSESNKPGKRQLVRWSDELDQTLLLAIQYACNDNGVKIPWLKVAEVMGPKFSEGAIVQHLAKLRIKMADCDMQVPPPLRRGSVAKEPSRLYVTPKKRKGTDILTPTSTSSITSKFRQDGKGQKNKKTKIDSSGDEDDDDDDDDVMPDLPDSDDDHMYKKKKKAINRGKKSTSGTKHNTNKTGATTKQVVKEEVEDTDVGGPAMRTRGININFAEMQANESDDESTNNNSGSSNSSVDQAGATATESVSPLTSPSASGIPKSDTVLQNDVLVPTKHPKIKLRGLSPGMDSSTNASGLQTPISANGPPIHSFGFDSVGTQANRRFGMSSPATFTNTEPAQTVLQSPFSSQMRTPTTSTSFNLTRNNSLISNPGITSFANASFDMFDGFNPDAINFNDTLIDPYFDVAFHGLPMPTDDGLDDPFRFDPL